MKDAPLNNQITIYETEDGKARIEVRFENENVWLTQKVIAELFECSADNISLHLKNIYTEKELDAKATAEEFSVVQQEGKRVGKRTNPDRHGLTGTLERFFRPYGAYGGFWAFETHD